MGASSSLPAPPSYSSTLPNPHSERGESAIYRHPKYMDELVTELVADDGTHIRTLRENFEHAVKVNPNGNCFGYRVKDAAGKAGDFAWSTYAEVEKVVNNVACGLSHLDLVPVNPTDGMRKLGFYSKNRMEWVEAQQACFRSGVIVVPLYDTLGADAVEYIGRQSEMTTVMCGAKELAVVLEVAGRVSSLRNAVVFDDVAADVRAQADGKGVKLYTFAELCDIGSRNPREFPPPKPEDVCTFCYTSGTTGDPKGAMETHRSVLADMAGAQVNGVRLTATDVHLSYLPLAHMFEVIVQVGVIGAGASIGFFQGDTLKLVEDIQALRPTIFPSVPRLYNRIYDKIMGGVRTQGGVKAFMFNKAFKSKKYWLQRGYLEYPLWDSLVFKKVRGRVGLDRCRFMLTGSAPIAPHVMDFLRIVFGCPVQEGYGQTESAAAATITFPDDFSVGHVGGPLACNEIKLVDVPEMEYTHKDAVGPRGEICYRGGNIFKGYYKMKEKTDEAIDAEGWLHSGDIAQILPNGAVKIIDRKKNIFKLSQGEYVAAEKIENVYTKSPLIAQAFVYGDSLQSCLVGIVVPDPDAFAAWARGKEFSGDVAALAANADVRKALLAEMTAMGTAASLNSFEKIKAVFVDPQPWTPEGERALLTPTFKLKRKEAREKYGAQIDAMYASGISVVAGQTGLRQGQ